MKESVIYLHLCGEMTLPDEQLFIDSYFFSLYKTEWLTCDYGRRVIKEVDSSDMFGGDLIISPVLGPIPPERLSGGAKTLIAAYANKDKIYPLNNLGDNCAEMLYVGALDGPTHWAYQMRGLPWNPKQIVIIAEKNVRLQGPEINKWLLHNTRAEDYYDLSYREDNGE